MEYLIIAIASILMLLGIANATINVSGTYANCGSDMINVSGVTCLSAGCISTGPGASSNINVYNLNCGASTHQSAGFIADGITGIRLINATFSHSTGGNSLLQITHSSDVYVENTHFGSGWQGSDTMNLNDVSGSCELYNLNNYPSWLFSPYSGYNPSSLYLTEVDNCYIHDSANMGSNVHLQSNGILHFKNVHGYSPYGGWGNGHYVNVTDSIKIEGSVSHQYAQQFYNSNMHLLDNSNAAFTLTTGTIDTQTTNITATMTLVNVNGQTIDNVNGILGLSSSSGNTITDNNFTSMGLSVYSDSNVVTRSVYGSISLTNSSSNSFNGNNFTTAYFNTMSSSNVFTDNEHHGSITFLEQSNGNQITTTNASTIVTQGGSYPYPLIGITVTNSTNNVVNGNGATVGCVDISTYSTGTEIGIADINCGTAAYGVGRTSTITDTNSVKFTGGTMNGIIMTRANSTDFSGVKIDTGGTVTLTDSHYTTFGKNNSMGAVTLTRADYNSFDSNTSTAGITFVDANHNTMINGSITGSCSFTRSDYNDFTTDSVVGLAFTGSDSNKFYGTNMTKAQVVGGSSLSFSNSSENEITGQNLVTPTSWAWCGQWGCCWIRHPAVTFSSNSTNNIVSKNYIHGGISYADCGQNWMVQLYSGSTGNTLNENILIDTGSLVVHRFIYNDNPEGTNSVSGNGYGTILSDINRNISGTLESLTWQNFTTYSINNKYYFADIGPIGKLPVNTSNYPSSVYNLTDTMPLTPNTTKTSPNLNVTITAPPNTLDLALTSNDVTFTYTMVGGTNIRNCYIAISELNHNSYIVQKYITCGDSSDIETLYPGEFETIVGAYEDGGADFDIIQFKITDSPPITCDEGFSLCSDGVCRQDCGGGPPVYPPNICTDCSIIPITCTPGIDCPSDLITIEINDPSTPSINILNDEKTQSLVNMIAPEGSIQASIPFLKTLLKMFVQLLVSMSSFMHMKILGIAMWMILSAISIIYGGVKMISRPTAISTITVIGGIFLVMTFGVFGI